MYGNPFTSQFGEAVEETWVTSLAGITGRQMADGLNLCLDRHPKWPPGAAQFRALCLGIVLDKNGNAVSGKHNTAAYKIFEPERLIESDEVKSKREEAGKKNLAGILGTFK